MPYFSVHLAQSDAPPLGIALPRIDAARNAVIVASGEAMHPINYASFE